VTATDQPGSGSTPLEPGPLGQHESQRAKAVAEFLPIIKELIRVCNLRADQAAKDFRLIVINGALRRQFEALNSTLLLASQNLGHHAVAFVRTALEEMLWVAYLTSLQLDDSQRLLLAMAQYDHIRSLSAQREFIGDSHMVLLGFPITFMDTVEAKLPEAKKELVQLRQKLGWTSGVLPSLDWIADQVGKKDVYRYLHSATSRSVHFSAGETFRRTWAAPGRQLTTAMPELRAHLSEFALDKLWHLLMDTVSPAVPLLQAAGITSSDAITDERLLPVLDNLLACGRVPLVHVSEWNLVQPQRIEQ